MFSLLRTEWLKLRKYPAFWWATGIIALSYPGINYIFYNIYLELVSKTDTAGQLVRTFVGNPFTFPDAWHSVAYFSSIFIFIPAVLVIMFITNEYSFKTHRQNIIDGWSRRQFMTAKMLDVFMVSMMVTSLYFIVALVGGWVNSKTLNAESFNKVHFVGLFALQTFSQLSLAFLVGFLLRKAFIALGIFLFYFIIVENMAVGYLKAKGNDEGMFLPFEISDRLVPIPPFLGRLDATAYYASLDRINMHVYLTLILIALTWGLCFYIMKKRDL